MGYFLQRLQTTLAMLRKEAEFAGLPFPVMLWQTAHFCYRTGLGPRYFVVAGMARADFPTEDKWHHISAADYTNALNVLNPPAYRKLTQNKLCEKALYNLLHIRTARMRGYFHPHKGLSDYGQPLRQEAHLDDLLGSLKDQMICCKPVEGWGGNGVKMGTVVIRQGKAQVEMRGSDQVLDARALIDSYREGNAPPEFIIEDYLRQSAQLSGFNEDSLNTFRLWVLCDEKNQTSVLGGYLRIGRLGSAVDNASAGGLICPVDLATGKIGLGITKHTPHRDQFSAHPDHGAPLQGEIIDQWPDICSFACDVLEKLPHTRFAGLDIAVTADGPVLVETNPEPDKDGAAHANIPALRLKQAALALQQ